MSETGSGQGFIHSKAGTAALAAAALVLVGISIYFLRNTFSSSEARDANSRVFMDTATNKTFNHTTEVGETLPVVAPSGSKTGYPTEQCFWTADGQTKTSPTYVLLKSYSGDTNEPTFCPDCGRLVVFNNPAPGPGVSPPPTKSEYLAHRGG